MTTLTPATRALLERPLVAIVAVGGGREPHAVPVWYRARVADEGRIVFSVWSDRSRHWIRRLQRDPAIQLVVAESEAPFAGVLASGEARLVHDDVLPEAARICERYIGAEEAPAYIEQWNTLDTIVEVEATRLRAWERGY
jgi:nitroimidazol reductase NimA-like FMN-containing flavoprotein (pyridoxamine 5'-phosphate oxidase superfamily)